MLLAFAAQLSYLNLPERAIAFLDEARRADPDYPPTLLSRAQVLIYLGRFDEARADSTDARAACRPAQASMAAAPAWADPGTRAAHRRWSTRSIARGAPGGRRASRHSRCIPNSIASGATAKPGRPSNWAAARNARRSITVAKTRSGSSTH